LANPDSWQRTGGGHVVKAFNTLFSNVLAAGPAEGRPVDVFIAGDDAQAKARVSAFIESLGLRPMDTGQLPMARALENAALLQLGLVAHSVKHTNFFLGVNILSLMATAATLFAPLDARHEKSSPPLTL
jgi:8-hydroxy-5-deazaflavin:NADPH oxidoreductase